MPYAVLPTGARYTFGPFRLEPDERRLFRDGVPVYLAPKEFDLLVVLVARAGHLVSKDELLAALWPDQVVEENALSVQVSKLRTALGESARTWRFIETVPRAGYRFADVVDVHCGTVTVREREAHVVVEGAFGRPRWGVVALVLAAALAVGLAVRWGGAAEPRPTEEVPAEVSAGKAGVPASEGLPPATAAEAYARGRAHWWTRQHPNEALYLFRSTVLLDSTFALGYVGIADVLGMSYQTGPEALAAIDQALALDPDLGAAYASLGFVRMFQEWDWAAAETAFDRALALDPDAPTAHQWLASLRMIQRRPGDAVAALERALAVAPPEARAVLYADRAQAHYYARRFDAAVADCRRALDHTPRLTRAHTLGFWTLALAGRADEAARWARRHELATPMNGMLTAPPATYAGPDGPRRLFADLAAAEYDRGTLWTAFWYARLHALTGDRDRAFEALDRLVRLRQFHTPFVAADPAFEALHDDPRFAAFVRRMGLAPPP